MSWVHIHLMTNHVPVIGTLIGIILLGYAIRKDSNDMKRFSLGYFVALGAITLLVYFTGEPAEEAIEHLPGFSEATMERHEDASAVALASTLFVSALSLAALVLRPLNLASRPWFWRTLLIASLVTGGLMGWVANLGGNIRHTEISGQAAPSPAVESENHD